MWGGGSEGLLRLLKKAAADSKTNEVGLGMEIEFLHNMFAVTAYGMRTQSKRLGNVSGAAVLRNQAEYLLLSGTEPGEFISFHPPTLRAVDIVRH